MSFNFTNLKFDSGINGDLIRRSIETLASDDASRNRIKYMLIDAAKVDRLLDTFELQTLINKGENPFVDLANIGNEWVIEGILKPALENPNITTSSLTTSSSQAVANNAVKEKANTASPGNSTTSSINSNQTAVNTSNAVANTSTPSITPVNQTELASKLIDLNNRYVLLEKQYSQLHKTLNSKPYDQINDDSRGADKELSSYLAVMNVLVITSNLRDENLQNRLLDILLSVNSLKDGNLDADEYIKAFQNNADIFKDLDKNRADLRDRGRNYSNFTSEEDGINSLVTVRDSVTRLINNKKVGYLDREGQMEQMNVNYPEIISRFENAILSSTIKGKLEHSFRGNFRIFSSQQNRTGQNLWQSIVFHNPTNKPVTVTIQNLNIAGNMDYSNSNGPGHFISSQALQGQTQKSGTISIPPGEYRTVVTTNHIPGKELMSMGQFKIEDGGELRAALVQTTFAPEKIEDLKTIIDNNKTVDPGDAPRAARDEIGLVNAVIKASTHFDETINSTDGNSFNLSSMTDDTSKIALDMRGGGTIAKYENTAKDNAGNYGCEYIITRNLVNDTDKPKNIEFFITSPNENPGNTSMALRQDFEWTIGDKKGTATIIQPPNGAPQLLMPRITLNPGERKQVKIRFFYSANNQPAHEIKIKVA